jgi:hypothetical protein
MKLPSIPFSVADWSKIPPVEHPGEQGSAFWRTIELGDVRIRLVEYTPGYVADHWCGRGHIIYVIEGELETEVKGGEKFLSHAGMGYHVSDSHDHPHRSRTSKGARLFIVD